MRCRHLFTEAAVNSGAENAREEAETVADAVNNGHPKHYMRNGDLFEDALCLNVSCCHFCPRLQLCGFFLRLVR